MSPPAVHGADASTLPRSGILTPSSEASLNRNDEESAMPSGAHKRKRTNSVAMEHLLGPPIVLKAHPPNLHMQPRVLHPLMLLPREHLPLGSFDLAAPHGELPPSRFYESHVKILDLESRLGSASSVLIARNESKGTIFALERHDGGLYVVCKLGSWVDTSTLVDHATVVCEERTRPPAPTEQTTELNRPSNLTTPQTRRNEKVKKTAIEAIQSLVRKRARSHSIANMTEASGIDGSTTEAEQSQSGLTRLPSPQTSTHTSSDPVSKEPLAAPIAGESETTIQHTADVLFENIRTLYFEALYKSKGSLAYFTKGPLSRARSTFHLDLESSLDMLELIDFLKSLILTTVQIDKKYRETVPELISQMKVTMDSSDEARKKRRRPKKMKLNKDGLYPMEDESIRNWWITNKPELKEDESSISIQQIKSHVSLLRSRETQLQMILIMEILALEILNGSGLRSDSSLPTLPGFSEATVPDMAPPPPPAKRRSKHNLPVLIDVHADRLTIWQSTASDELLLLEDTQVPSESANSQVDPRTSTEPLKDFCVDVILPFYSSRLPQLCDSLNRKLGGPVTISPPKAKSMKRPTKKEKDQRPGAAAKRSALRKEPRTLERALSFDQQHRRSISRGPSNVLALMRPAASVPTLTIKREDSDSTALKTSSAAKSETDLGASQRASLVRSSSMADLRDVKAAKKAKVDAELKDAISALRKPNRDVVGKAMAEAAEQRTSSTAAKKVRKLSRPSAKSHIQVEATPANNRFRNALGFKAGATPDVPLPSTEEIIPPSSIGAHVPSTVPRNRHTVFEAAKSPAFDAIGCTPVRPSTSASFLRRPAVEEPMILPSSPLMSRKSTQRASPSASGSMTTPAGKQGILFAPHNPANVLLETPIKKASQAWGKGNEVGSQTGKENNVSIYAKLGWDDDDLYDL